MVVRLCRPNRTIELMVPTGEGGAGMREPIRAAHLQRRELARIKCLAGNPVRPRDAGMTGRPSRHQIYADPAIEARVTVRVPSGMAVQRTTGIVDSLSRPVDLHRSKADCGTCGGSVAQIP